GRAQPAEAGLIWSAARYRRFRFSLDDCAGAKPKKTSKAAIPRRTPKRPPLPPSARGFIMSGRLFPGYHGPRLHEGKPMSIEKSLRRKNSLERARNVLTRGERIKTLMDD